MNTIVDAINDNNVLPFRIDYVDTVNRKAGIGDKQVKAIDTEKALADPRRVKEIVKYILEHFDQKTKRNGKTYSFRALRNIEAVATDKTRGQVAEVKDSVRLSGFNSIFAVSSIAMAKAYYLEFKRQMQDLPEAKRLRVATIFSYAPNEDVEDANGMLGEENSDDTSQLDASSRDFLESAIKDYNALFKTHYDTSADRFQNYYKDLSLRMKNREVDILIVVNMFLTGFDATTLNTLWVDKNLVMHGLIQAFSRTNRILNSVKTYGNIVCFRNLEEETNEALALFGDSEAGSVVLLKNYKAYYDGYDEGGKHHDGYEELIAKLQAKFPLGQPIVGDQNKKDFIALFGAILRMKNILTSFDDFAGNELLAPRDMQDYQSRYLDLYHEMRTPKPDKEVINDDIVFEMELIFRLQCAVCIAVFRPQHHFVGGLQALPLRGVVILVQCPADGFFIGSKLMLFWHGTLCG